MAELIFQKRQQPSEHADRVRQRRAALQDNRAVMQAGKLADGRTSQLAQKPNNTGLPNNLKSGIESLSGMSMDNVRVHYNSSKPAQLNAHAYAQGTDIHVAPGQEQHLPHETWHVVQQAQGRVQPTMQMKGGVAVNDNAGLEREADVMGAKALQNNPVETSKVKYPVSLGTPVAQLRNSTEIVYQGGTLNWATTNAGANVNQEAVGLHTTAFIDPEDPVHGERTAAALGIYGGAGSGNYRAQNSGHNLTQGHLLNANLGGKAQSYNLFPITAEMNRAHSSQVEEVVKSLVLHVKQERSAEHAERYAVAAAMAAMPPATHGVITAAGGWHAYQNANPLAPGVLAASFAAGAARNNALAALDSERGRAYTSAEGGVAAGLPGAAAVPTGGAAAVTAADRAILAGAGAIGAAPTETQADAGQTGVNAAGRVATARMGAIPMLAGAGLPTTAPPRAIATEAAGGGGAVPAGPLQWDNTRVFYDIRVDAHGVNGKADMKPNNLRNEKFICTAYMTSNNGISDRNNGSRIAHTVQAPNNQNAKLAELGFEPHAAPEAGLHIGPATAGAAALGIPTQHNVLDGTNNVVGHATLFQHA